MLFLPSFFSQERPGKFGVIMMAVWLFVSMQAAPPASGQEVSPGQVKAAFLYNFAKFVDWPPGVFADHRDPIALCILKDEPLAAAVMALRGKEVQGRKIIVKQDLSLEEMKRCQIFFASAALRPRLLEIMQVLRNCPVLTVTDEVNDFARLGVIINLTRQEDKIRFAISNDNAGSCSLKISSQLLKLAVLVGR